MTTNLEELGRSPEEQKIFEKIKQRRSQMLVHSCLYYELDTAVVTDDQWQKWADELTQLQKDYPNLCENMGWYDDYFRDWTGATGMHLPHRDPWVLKTARYLLDNENLTTNTL